MNKIKTLTLTILVMTLLVFTFGCKSTSMITKLKQSEIVDWSNRNLDSEAKPEWLQKLLKGNSEAFKKEFEIDNSYVIKYGIASGKTRDLALAASRVNYNAMRAEELRTKVVSEAASVLNDDGLTDVTANAAMVAKVDLSGHELVTQFWQEIVTFDKENDSKKTEFICYSVYKITKENWMETLKTFMKSVLPSLPNSDAQVKMAGQIASLHEQTTTEVEKSQNEVLAEINAKLDAAQNTTSSAVAPAPSSSDVDWLSVLETAANIIF